MYRVKHHIAPKIKCKLFNETNVPYYLRQDVSFCSYNVKTALYGTETLSYLGPKIWNLVSFDIRACATEQIFPNLGFIDQKQRYVDWTCVLRNPLSIDL